MSDNVVELLRDNGSLLCERAALVIEGLREENERIREGVRNWSYCTSQGMYMWCPEKVHKLNDFLVSLGIAPFHIAYEHREKRDE